MKKGKGSRFGEEGSSGCPYHHFQSKGVGEAGATEAGRDKWVAGAPAIASASLMDGLVLLRKRTPTVPFFVPLQLMPSCTTAVV